MGHGGRCGPPLRLRQCRRHALRVHQRGRQSLRVLERLMAGSLAIPTVFAGHSPQAVSTLDTDLTTIANYVNVREVTLGALSARPAAGNPGAWFVATDTN